MKPTFLICLFTSLVYFLFPVNVIACSCSPEVYAPACQILSSAPAVFLGEPVEFDKGVYRFRVERVYKGLDPDTTETLVYGWAGTSCEAAYAIGEKYIIFAQKSPRPSGTLSTSMCSGSRRANEGDITFLENYIKGKTETVVFGQVLEWVTSIGPPSPDESNPVIGASIVLENDKQKYTTVSDRKGMFNFAGIPEGDYQLSARLNIFKPDPLLYKVSVIDGGCRLVFVQLKSMSGISGTLLFPDGKPATNTRMELLRKNQKGEWYSTYYMWKQTDGEGKFKFDELESGEYLLGYEIRRDYPSTDSAYPTYYFPNTRERSKAQTITLSPGQTIADLKLVLPQKQTERKITVKLIFPDGTPAGRNWTIISNKGNSILDLDRIAEGVYTFTGYQEREYDLSAKYWIDDLMNRSIENKRVVKSKTIKIAPGKNDAEVVLVLDESFTY